MTTPQEKVDTAIKGIADDLREHVAKIEAGIATTMNHYGDYMNLIMAFDLGGRVTVRKVIALALIEAGANRQGVADALKAVT